jgi:gluconolactonase
MMDVFEEARAAGLVPEQATLERIHAGSEWAEGVTWLPKKRAVRWSDIPKNRILEWRESTGETTVFRKDAGYPNGRALDLDGCVVQCSHARRGIERETENGTELIANRWGKGRFHSPNDLVVTGDGAIWFTDPPYGLRREHAGPDDSEREYEGNFVFRLDPEDGVAAPVITDVEEPNGLAFSPEEDVLYIADSSSHHRSDGSGNHCIWQYRRCASGWGPRELFAVITPGIPDGIRVDEAGRLWSSSADSIQVFSTEGQRVARIPVPETVGNLTFGGSNGNDIYVAAATSIYRFPTTTRNATAKARGRRLRPHHPYQPGPVPAGAPHHPANDTKECT